MQWMLIVIVLNSGPNAAPGTFAGGLFESQEACLAAGGNMSPGVRGSFGWRYYLAFECAPAGDNYE